MKKTVKIKGMMCPHCEARVKKALEELPGVSSAEASHKKGAAVVTFDGNIDDKALKDAVTAAGYEVIEVK
jgi:Cu2+-exporting ATPase